MTCAVALVAFLAGFFAGMWVDWRFLAPWCVASLIESGHLARGPRVNEPFRAAAEEKTASWIA